MLKTDNFEKTNNSELSNAIKQFILDHFPLAKRRELTNNDPLIESGIIDSLGVLDVVGFIESEFKVKVDDEDLTPENFQTISRMAAYVEQKRNGLQ